MTKARQKIAAPEVRAALAVITGRKLRRTSLRPRLLRKSSRAGGSASEKGIMRRNGPMIAWFKDPAGNILSVLEATM
jgi:hypothetical protein